MCGFCVMSYHLMEGTWAPRDLEIQCQTLRINSIQTGQQQGKSILANRCGCRWEWRWSEESSVAGSVAGSLHITPWTGANFLAKPWLPCSSKSAVGSMCGSYQSTLLGFHIVLILSWWFHHLKLNSTMDESVVGNWEYHSAECQTKSIAKAWNTVKSLHRSRQVTKRL